MAPLMRLIFLITLFFTFTLSAPVPLAAKSINKGRLPLHVRTPEPVVAAPVEHVKHAKRSTASTDSSNLPLPFLKRFLKKSKVVKRATPAAGLKQSDLGKCIYVGADFKSHDCNELLDVEAASLNSAKTPAEKALVQQVTEKLIAEGKLAPPSK